MADQKFPIALLSVNSAEFIDYIQRLHRAPTTLVICASRESFLQNLQADIRRPNRDSRSDAQENSNSVSSHHLLTPTIHLLASSRTVNIAFTPTLPHLRAFLADFNLGEENSSYPSAYQRPGLRFPMLAILSLATVHQSTSEYSAQGLSRTVAIAVETANSANMRLVLAEPHDENGNELDTIRNPWEAKVPLLNGSIRFGEDEKMWAGRTVDVGRVIGRWCKIVRRDEEIFGVEQLHSR